MPQLYPFYNKDQGESGDKHHTYEKGKYTIPCICFKIFPVCMSMTRSVEPRAIIAPPPASCPSISPVFMLRMTGGNVTA